MQSFSSLGLALVLLLGALDPLLCVVHHIVPSRSYFCNADSCLTFSQFTNDSISYVDANTTLVIVGGSHDLDREIAVSNIETFTMFGMNSSITCRNHAKLTLASIGHVYIGGLTFIGCGSNRVTMVDQLTIEYTMFWGLSNSRTSILISETDATITESSFLSNTIGSCQRDASTNYPESSCTATVGGALIISRSTLIIDNCYFEGNSANLGGTIFSEFESNITIINSDFTDNHATDCGAQFCFGGVLFADETASVSIFNSTFQNNTSDGDGGVVYTRESDSTTLEINDSKFVKNSANNDGGVLYAQMEASITISNCSILNNTAGGDGGAIRATNNTSISVSNSIFGYNTAHVGGGVIRLTINSSVMITTTTFYNSKTEFFGGVISLRDGSHAVISSSGFYHNVANKYGGAIHMEYDCTVLINDTMFDNNFASDEGGVFDAYTACSIKVYGSTFSNSNVNVNGGVSTIKFHSQFYSENCSFSNNSARDNGAVLFIDEDSHTIIHDSNFMQNSADNGGVLVALRKSNVTIDNSKFIRNKAFTDGGTLHTRIQCTTTIHNSNFTDNIAINNGVLLASVSSNVTVENSNFNRNKAGHDGGFAFIYDDTKLCMNNCNFTGNRAGGSGGAVYGRKNSTIEIFESNISDCTAQLFGGSISIQEDTNAAIKATNLTNNNANTGGVMRAYIRSTISITNSTLCENSATISGGAMAAYKSSTVNVQTTNFTFNQGGFGGVAFVFEYSTFVFESCHFLNNVAEFEGIFKLIQQSTVTVIQSTFKNNTAISGGVAYVQDSSSMFIESSNFEHNSAREKGGVIYSDDQTTLSINTSNFTSNMVMNDGGVMTLLRSSITMIENCSFTNNSAHSSGGVIGIQDSYASVLSSTFSSSLAGSSGGVVRAINSSVIFNDTTFIENNVISNGGVVDARISSSIVAVTSYFFNNTAQKSGGILHLEEQSSAVVYNSSFYQNTARSHGGVISVTAASVVNVTETTFIQNTAEKGGAIAARKESSISFDSYSCNEGQSTFTTVEGVDQIYNNTADVGGGIFLSNSTLHFNVETHISHNLAHTSGGGMHATNSSIIIRSTIKFEGNKAVSGGGVSLANSKLYDMVNNDSMINVDFVLNRATDNGGALYVVDDINRMCSSDSYSNNSGCFFQNLTNGVLLNFDDNNADSRGSDLFGGLLDRCTVISNTNLTKSDYNGAARFKELSNLQNLNSVSSGPVRVCSCKDNEPDCSQQEQSIQIRRGDMVTISIVAVDQVNQPVTAIVQSSFNDISLPESQTVQRIGSNCTIVDYDLSFPTVGENHELTIFAEGPCNDEGISKFVVDVHVSSCVCAIGFMPAGKISSGCSCICDQRITNYITDCDFSTKSVIRMGLFWITYLNDTDNDDYFIYPYCPLDYCQPPSNPIPINLNLPQGSDAQCANNHRGILCGSCQPGYSLSLGGSKCTKCPSNWYALFIVIIISSLLAGTVLVVVLLVLNLTVAIGTINPIIFYANIIYSNRRVYFGQPNLTFIPVFISWLNLDIGIDTCFFEGMDAYAKTWLQLAFPVYIIFLVFMIIWVSSCSSKFSHLLGKRDPVATLATLILLSYTKLLETIITTFSFARFEYSSSNRTTTLRWLPDASVEFGKGKHVALICVALLILFLCLVYMVLIFVWQWLLYCSRSKLFKWTRNHKLHSFINTYHTPHNAKHRYWTGLLLLLRVLVYLITAVSASSDQPITPLTTVAIMCCLLLYKTVLIIRVYKNWLLNSMEAFVYFNIAIYALITSYTIANPPSKSKEILHDTFAYLSVGATLLLFLMVIAYHMYRYGCSSLYTFGKNTKIGKKIRHHGQLLHLASSSSPANDILDVIDNQGARSGGATAPTTTVVSLTNLDQSSIATSPNQSITEEHTTPTHSDQSEQDIHNNYNSDGNRSMQALGMFTSKSVKVTTQLQGTKRAKPKLLYYSADHHIPLNENIRKPLLDEDNL